MSEAGRTEKSRSNRKALEGQVLYGWDVLAYEGNHKHKSYYWCQCRCCGQLYLRRADKLLAGRTRRCGECAADRITYEGEEAEVVKQLRVPKKLRQKAYDKYDGRCAYCGEQLQYKDMEIDYIKPLQQGGKMEIENLLPSCRVCNRKRKGDQLEKFRKLLQHIPKVLEKDSTYRLAKKYGIVQDDINPIVQFYFETGRNVSEDNIVKAMKSIKIYCAAQNHSCENCPMEVNCSHGLEPREWQT